ncbi:unnamed protein product [Linum trigynum]|uniref:Uncharacterized protein n=1 Tax=Linum trigynum TaxID=586398 RepID=A0AAV2F9N8_9ROSI
MSPPSLAITPSSLQHQEQASVEVVDARSSERVIAFIAAELEMPNRWKAMGGREARWLVRHHRRVRAPSTARRSRLQPLVKWWVSSRRGQFQDRHRVDEIEFRRRTRENRASQV